MVNRIFPAAGGDGASLTVPRRKGTKVFKCVSQIFMFPRKLFVELDINIITRGEWRRWQEWIHEEPGHCHVDAGPIVVVFKLRSLPYDDPKWREEIVEALVETAGK